MPFVDFRDEVIENKSVIEYQYENCLVSDSNFKKIYFKKILSISVSLTVLFIVNHQFINVIFTSPLLII